MRARDNKSGFVLCSRSILLEILDHKYKYAAFQSFITVAAHSKGYQIREVETLFEDRKYGESFIKKFPVKLVLDCLLDICKAVVEYRIFPKRESFLSGFLKSNPTEVKIPTMTGWRRALFEFYFAITPFHKWLITRKARNYYLELNQTQWLPRHKIKELQLRKFQNIVTHAYNHVPYYRERMDHLKIKPEDINSLDDIAKLPLLNKSDVRKYIHFDLLSDNHNKKKILKIQTSGSTGEPFVIYADKHQLELRWAATQRGLEWSGYRFGDKCIRLWHQTLGMSKLQVFREKMDAFLTRRRFIPAYQMTASNLGEVIEQIRSYKPVLIDGYAESFNLLASYLKANPTSINSVKGIVSSAQELPDQSRSTISKAFNCGVFDKYGCREFSGVAYECEKHDGHHIVEENFIVEVLKEGVPAKPGEIGEIVITDLSNFCMPMIRYRVGDLAVAYDNTKPCACGRGLDRIGKIEGRVQAMIVGKNNEFLPGTFFAHFFKDHENIVRKYQIIQDEDGAITLKIIKGNQFTDVAFNELIATLKKYLGKDTPLELEFVDSIAMVRTGKHQGAISRLKIDFQKVATLNSDFRISPRDQKEQSRWT